MAYKGKIPFDGGSLMHYATNWYDGKNTTYDSGIKWRDNFEWCASLQFLRFERGRSAAYAVFRDKANKEYPMFLTYFEEVLELLDIEHGHVKGNWTFYKRGMNYSIGLVRNKDERRC